MSANIFQDPESGDWYSGPAPGAIDDEERLRERGIVKDPATGDYYQVPESSIANWRKPQPLMSPQAPTEPSIADGVGLADYARSVMAGGAQIGQAAGWLTRMLGAEDLGSAIEELGRNAVDYWNEGLSPAAKDALSREFVRKNEAGEYEWGDASLHTVGLFGAQSLLGSMAGAGAGAGITKVLQTFANPVGRTALMRAAQAGSEQALKKLALVDKVIGAAGFASGEGVVGGASAGVNVYDRVMSMPPEEITNNDRYRQVFESTDESLPLLERHQYAAETVAREASSLAGLQSGLTTALLGAPMGAFFGSVFGKSMVGKLAQGRAARAGAGAAGEAAQEFAQSGTEQLITNKALQGAGADVDTWDDVLNQALGGALAGAPMGAALGLAEQPEITPQPKIPSLDEMAKAVPPPEERLALPAPRGEADFTVGPDGEVIPRGETRPERLALPPPGGNADFTVTSEGETIPRGEQRTTPPDEMQQWARDARATTADIRAAQAERAQQEGATMGTAPTKVPGTNAKQWNQQTLQRLKESATEAKDAGVERQAIVDLLSRTARGEVTPLAARRELLQMQERATAERKSKALPAPRQSNTVQVSSAGEARVLTEAEARQADEQRAEMGQQRVDLGTAPTVVPGTGQKKWTAASKQRVKAAVEQAVTAGVPREVAQGVVTRMNKGEITPLIAARNLKQLQSAQVQAPAPAPAPLQGTAQEAPEASRETPAAQAQGKPVTTEGGKTYATADQVMTDGTVLKTIDVEKLTQRKPLLSRGPRFAGRPAWDMAAMERQNHIDSTAAEFAGIVQEEYSSGTQSAKNILDGFEFNAEQARIPPAELAEAAATRLEKHPQATSRKAAALIREKYGTAPEQKPTTTRGAGQDRQRIGLLPRDMREDLFNQHATFSNPDAKQSEFNMQRVPRRTLRIDNIEGLDEINPEQLDKYGDPRKLPPVVIADGRLIDGQHRIGQAKRRGITELEAIDMTGLINTDEAGYIAELPTEQRSGYAGAANEADQATTSAQSSGAAPAAAPGNRFARSRQALRSHRERNGPASRSYTRRSGTDGGSRRVLGVEPVAAFTPSDNLRNTLTDLGAAAPTLHELGPEGAQAFADSLAASKQGNKYGAAVYVYPVEEYRQMRLFLAEDGKAGFALKGDDIVSVFALAPHKGAAAGMLELAVQEGGRRLDAFDTVLPDIYAASGFRTVARIGWNDDYAPEGWDKGTFGAFNGGEPDVVFMVYDPANAEAPTNNDGQRVEDYDAAVALQKEAVTPRRRQGAAASRVRTAGDVQEELKEFTAAISPLINVQIWETVQEFQAATGARLPTDGSGKIKGVWLGDNTVHLVGENLAQGEALEVAVHEVFGHLAIERLPGGEPAIQSVRRQIESGAAWVKPYVDKIASQYGNITSDEMAREVIAHMAEEGVDNRIMTRLMRAVREFLRKLGWKGELSEGDVRDLIARSARALRQDLAKAREKLRSLTPAATDQQILDAIDEEIPPGVVEVDAYLALRAMRDQVIDTAEIDAELARLEGKTPGGDNTLRLKKPLRSARQNQIDTPEFKRWFSDSKVVDKDGKPQPVFHGTGAKFNTFRKAKATQGIFWVTSDRSAIEKGEVGAQGKGQILDLYASIKNPAGWPEYQKYSLGELKREGYDGAILREKDGSFVAFVFEPEQLKSASRNRGTFDPSSRNILFKRAAAADPEVQAILDRVMVKPPEAMTMRDRARELWHKITDVTGLQLKQGFVDSFASIEKLERDANNGALRDAADSAYKAALATKNLSSVMAGVMLKGVPSFRNGAYVPEPGRRGIIDIFDPLTRHKDGNLLSQWEGYAAARRASRLIKEQNVDGSSRENLFTQAEIDTLLKLEQRYPEFARVFDEWQTFNKQVLDLAQDAGIIDPETRVLWERNDYVPFYRAADELGGKTGPSNKGGLANQRSGIKTLHGSAEMLGNVFENMMMNTAHLIDASFKNRAMERIVELGADVAMQKVDLKWEAIEFNDAQLATALRNAGIEVDKLTKAQREHWSTMFRRIAPKGPNIVSVMRNGKPEYYEVTDPLVLHSIAGLGYDNFTDVFGLFRGSKKLLTHAITADPAFMVANFVRDTLSNWVISDAGTKPMIDAVKAMGATLKDDPDLVQLMMAGAGGGGFYDSAPEDIRKLIADRVPANKQRAFLDSVVGPKNVWRLWRKIGAAAENANRIATFRAVIAAGGSVAEAAYQARDVLNFSMAGNFGAMRWLTQSVPFLNARIQGLYRLYRGARDNKRAFFTKGLMLTAATMALALANADDDEYEELPEWDKDTYWHLFVGGEHFRIPKPFEIGALFSTVPERLFRTASGRDSAGLLADRMFQMAADTFAFNPVPQLVKPIIEQYANRSMFTGSPIVGMAEQNLQPEAQFTPWTSETMRELAKLMPDFAPAWLRSPRRLEAALRAYTGAIGMYLLSAADAGVRTAMGYAPEPSRKVYDLPVVTRFWEDPNPRHTKYADQLYEMMDEANAISSTINRFTRERRFEEAAEMRTANKDKLAVRVRLNRLGTQVRNVNNQIRLIQLDERMDPDTKRQRIDGLVDRKNRITREVARYSDVF